MSLNSNFQKYYQGYGLCILSGIQYRENVIDRAGNMKYDGNLINIYLYVLSVPIKTQCVQ